MKRNIAIVWGGYSSEAVVSAKSAAGIYSFIDKEKYNIYKVQIVKAGWTVEANDETYPIDKNDFSFFDLKNKQKVDLDFAYITIHGTPGEDGSLQGYLDMLDIKYSNTNVLTSSLTFNKYVCNNFLKQFDFIVADSVRVKRSESYNSKAIVEQLGLPMFVKPSNGGSSFATTKVKSEEQIKPAIEEALVEGSEVIIESFIEGREVTCGCFKIGDKCTVLPITEAISKNEFFDYGAKYNGEVEEVTPAQISTELTNKIQALTLKIYDLVDAKGIIRADFIIKNNIPYLLEVNTTPGMTPTSFIPQQIAAAGLSITNVLTEIIENEY